ncbi:hypothetical protein BCR44DRAFT_74422 [Catenaria anguillulae PL171]|uniref:Mixed lineage kinase domain-containing protein n=1 Tax=Catenaria anguillulae PL171 TaxID=765915 RepID=A0A1Y2I5E6_9FUNG|nr:hypothetical protein BCR44DRAFT_74422 [Catenaria anguillulae PL171]
MASAPLQSRSANSDSLPDDSCRRTPAAARIGSLTTKSRSWAARPRPAARMCDTETLSSGHHKYNDVPQTDAGSLEWSQSSTISLDQPDPNQDRLTLYASLIPTWPSSSGSFASTSSQTKGTFFDSQSLTSIDVNGTPSSMLVLASTRHSRLKRVGDRRTDSLRAAETQSRLLVKMPSKRLPVMLQQNPVAKRPPSRPTGKRVGFLSGPELEEDLIEDVDPLRTQKVDQALGLVRFLRSVAGNTPVIGALARCLEVMVGIERVTEDNRDQAGLLFNRVVYVVAVIQRLYDSGHWRPDTAQQILAEVSGAVEASTKFFLKYRSQTPLQRRFYSSQNRQRLDLLNQHLGNALTHLSVTLQLDTVLRLDSVTTVTNQDDAVDAQVESFIELNGGPAAVQGIPEKISALARLVGVEYSSGHVREIAGTYEDLERYLDTVLSTMMGQTTRLEQLDHQVATLSTRGDAYKDIQCAAIRELWRRAGWGLSVATQRLTELLMDVVRMEASTARFHGLIHDDVFLVIMDRFPVALGRLDSNQGTHSEGNVTVSELNSFFPWDLSLLDWARVILFVTDDFETRQFHAAAQLCQDICDSIRQQPPTARFSTFWRLLDSKIATLGDYCLALSDNLFSYMDPQLYFDQLDCARAALSRVRSTLAAPEPTWNESVSPLGRGASLRTEHAQP